MVSTNIGIAKRTEHGETHGLFCRRHLVQQLHRRAIRPMQIVQHDEYRPLCRHTR
jgi:hypothetical protein